MNQRRPTGNRPGEFSAGRGERVVAGTKDLYAVRAPLGNIPVGPAPPNERQVISTFDSRPIGGYDMCITGSFSLYSGTPVITVQSPIGYCAIVRRIELESSPAYLCPADLEWIFQSAGVFQNAWSWKMGKTLSERAIDVFFPVPSNSPFGIKEVAGGFSGATTSATVYARFIGNLILDDATPVTQQVGSLPPGVRVVQKKD